MHAGLIEDAYSKGKKGENSKKKVKYLRKTTPKQNGTILLLALTLWDKKLEIHIPCPLPDAKAVLLGNQE